MTTDLRQTIEAELDRRERIAQAATDGPWAIWRDLDHQGFYTVGDEAGVIPEGQDMTDGECNPTAHVYIEPDADHIALHDPTDALRRYTAARRVLARHQLVDHHWPGGDHEDITACAVCIRYDGDPAWPCEDLKILADSLGLSTTTSEEQP